MQIPDGFPGQRMLVLAKPREREFLQQPGTSHIVVTDCGYFPEALSHGHVRRRPVNQAVIIVCVKGSGWCETEAGRFEVRSGQAIILEPDKPHSYGTDDDDPWTLWWLHVAGREVPEFLSIAGMSNEAPVRTLSDVYRISSLVTEIVQWMERDSTTSSLQAAAGSAWHLLSLLAADRTVANSTTAVIDHAAAYLRAHIDEHTSISELASMASLSPSHFAAQFRRQIGYPVLQYQAQLRMARARELLDVTTQSIGAVAQTVGYTDPFYFTRQFKKIHGVTPRQYRSQRRA